MYCQLAFQQGLIRITNSCEKLRFIFEIVYSEICCRGSIFTFKENIQVSQRCAKNRPVTKLGQHEKLHPFFLLDSNLS